MASTSLEKEIGHGNTGLVPWSELGDVEENVPELVGQNAITTYNKMRHDAQIASLLLAFTLPIRRYRWYVEPNGARDQVVEWVAQNLSLPIAGLEDAPQGRRRDRFSHDRHLFHALLNLPFGHMYFEQVYRFDDAAKLYRLRKLAPRMPGSISEINVARDGGLDSIRQFPSGWTDMSRPSLILPSLQQQPIPVTQLVAYINEQEGGNWRGVSWLRALYRHWLRKDRLLRVDAINGERNGAGVPLGYAPPNATDAQIQAIGALARSYRSGESAGGGLPNGADIRFKGVEGTLPDVLASIRYDDEQMASRFLGMFTKLGTTETGSRALGQTLVDFFALAQEAVAKQYADVTNEHVIEDLIDVNWTIDESAPLLKFDIETDKRYSVADLIALIESGALQPYPELEEYLRTRGDLPKPENAPEQQDDEDKDDDQDHPTPLRPAAQSRIQAAMTVGGRTLRRNPLPFEVTASVDFEGMDGDWTAAQQSLVEQWSTEVKAAQIEALVAAVADADSLDELADLDAPILGESRLIDAMTLLADAAGEAAVAEAAAQQVELDPFDIDTVAEENAARASAQATVMARSISQAAAQKAITEAGSGLAMEEVASRVDEYLNGLSNSYLEDQLGGTLMQAQNGARRAVFENAPGGTIYASELLDSNTCKRCKEVDGTDYDSMTDAIEDYPSGGYSRCFGGSRCRGTLVWVAAEESPASV